MNSSRSMTRVVTLTAAFVALGAFSVATNGQTQGQMQPLPAAQAPAQAAPAAQAAPTAQAPAGAPAQAQSVCANQPFCYEAQDFVAVITDFRTSVAGYSKIIDVTMRFLNKTPNPLVLGYTNGSGIALDDKGNRYGVGGGNGVRGMGLVNGGNFDPRFSIRPGGYGDSRFELLMPNNPQIIYGFTFELDMSVNEISTLEGNQHSLGSEFPLQFQGLTNGAKGNVPGIPAGGSGFFGGANPMMAAGAAPACGPAGTISSVAGATNSAAAQNAANTATNTASTAATALSNLKSLFGKKNAAQAAPSNAAATTPCVPAAGTTAPTAAAGNVVAQPAGTAAAQPPVTVVTPATGAAPAAAPAAAATNTPAAKAPAANAQKSAAPPAKPAAKSTTAATTTQQKTTQPQ